MKLYDVRIEGWLKVRAHSAQDAAELALERANLEDAEITDVEEDYPEND